MKLHFERIRLCVKIFIKTLSQTSRKLKSFCKVISLKSFLCDKFCNVPCGRMQAPYIPVFRHLPKALKVLKPTILWAKEHFLKHTFIVIFWAPPHYLGLSKGHQKNVNLRQNLPKLAKCSRSLCKKDTGLKNYTTTGGGGGD